MNHAPLLLAVDGGGSKTTACLAHPTPPAEPNEVCATWNILGQGHAPTSNPQATNPEQSNQALEEAIRQAMDEANLSDLAVQGTCLAIAGCDRPADKQRVRDWASRYIATEHLCIVNDAEPVLAGGTPEQWGIALIAGTGSFCWGRHTSGKTARAGGWGYLIGDEGSGFACGQAAVQAVSRQADGRGPSTSLYDPILAHYQCHDATQLITKIYRAQHPQAAIAALAPIVLAEAAAADMVSVEIIQEAGLALARMVRSVAHQLNFPHQVPLALAGGLLTGSPLLQETIQQQLENQGLVPDPVHPVTSPVEGALRLAYEPFSP